MVPSVGLGFSLGTELEPLVPEEPPVLPNVPRLGVKPGMRPVLQLLKSANPAESATRPAML